MAPIKGDKLWRTVVILVLCGLVYYFSFDHGRSSMAERAAAEQESAKAKIESLVIDHARLTQDLKKCSENLEQMGGGRAGELGDTGSFSLRTGQSRLLFNDSLVLTLLEVNNLENHLKIQINKIDEGLLSTEELGAGVSFQIQHQNQNWALVVTSMQMSQATFTLIAVK